MSRAKGRRVMTTPDNTERTEDREFYAINDGIVGRPSNTFYLDMREREEAETLRARAEGREPNYNEGSLPAAVGTQLVVNDYRVDNRWRSNPAMLGDAYEDKKVDPVSTLPVSLGAPAADIDLGQAAQVANERRAQDEALASETDKADETGRANENDLDLDTLGDAGTNTRDTTI